MSSYTWSTPMITDLVYIVNFLKNHTIGAIVELLANSFIDKHSQKLSLDNYSMVIQHDSDKNVITEAEYKLAYICELVFLYGYMKKKKDKMKNKKKKIKLYLASNVFFCFGYMLASSIHLIVKFKHFMLDNKLSFLNNVLYNTFSNSSFSNNSNFNTNSSNTNYNTNLSDKLLLSSFNISSNLTLELLLMQSELFNIYDMHSLLLSTEIMKTDICNEKISRDIRNILDTKKILYFKVLFVLSYEIYKNADIINKSWIYRKIHLLNEADFLCLFNDSLVETLIFITAYRLYNIGYR